MAQRGVCARRYRSGGGIEPGDELVGQWPRDKLEAMHNKFARAIAKAEHQAAEQRAPTRPRKTRGTT
jgi:hypothetical protein